MSYHGDFEDGDVIDFLFTTRNTSGVPTTLAGTPSLDVYDTNLTAPIAGGGETLEVDFNGVTGLNRATIDTSLTAASYAAGNDYSVIIAAGTVGGTSVVGEVVGSFSIQNRKADVHRWLDTAVLGTGGLPHVDVHQWLDTAVSHTSGLPHINAVRIGGSESAADALSGVYRTGIQIADVGTTTTIVDAALTEGDDFWNGCGIAFVDGSLAGQTATVIDFDAASDTITFSPAADSAVATGQQYVLLPFGGVSGIWDEVITGARHNIASSAGKYIRNLEESGRYTNGFVFIDTLLGTAGSEDYVNGTDLNPVDANTAGNPTDARTLAASLGLDKFKIAPASSLTFNATTTNEEWWGDNWTLALGGQDIGGTLIHGADISGTATGASPRFEWCEFTGAADVAAGSRFDHCSFDNTLTCSATGDYRFVDCQSGVAGAGSPTFDLTAGGAVTCEFRRWSGGMTVTNIGSGDVVSIDCISGGTVTVNGTTGGVVHIRGMVNVVDSSGGVLTITQTNAINRDSIADAVWDEDATTHTTADSAGNFLNVLAAELENRIDGQSLNDLLGVPDTTSGTANLVSEVLDMLNTDTIAQPGKETPAASQTLFKMVAFLYKAWRNKSDDDGATYQLYNDDGATVDQQRTVSDTTAGTFTSDEVTTGP